MDREINVEDVQSFAARIFTKPPQDACAHELTVDTDGGVESLMEIMIILFSQGVKYCFSHEGRPVDITNMDEEKLALLQKYFNSFGIQFFITVEPSSLVRRGHFDFNGANLSDNTFNLYRNGMRYQLFFDFIHRPADKTKPL